MASCAIKIACVTAVKNDEGIGPVDIEQVFYLDPVESIPVELFALLICCAYIAISSVSKLASFQSDLASYPAILKLLPSAQPWPA